MHANRPSPPRLLRALSLNSGLTLIGLVASSCAFYLSNSHVILAEFLRSLCDALGISATLILHRVTMDRQKVDRLASRIIASAMTVSGLIVLASACHRLSSPVRTSGTGLLIAFLTASCSGIINTCVCRHNARIYRETALVTFKAQTQFFRAKTFANVCVSTSTALSYWGGHLPFISWIDPVGALLLAFYILYSAFSIFKHTPILQAELACDNV